MRDAAAATAIARRRERCADGRAARARRALAARGPRAEGRREEYELLVEAIYEGYLLHYGDAARGARAGGRPRLLAGDRLYAIGLARLVALGDTQAVAELADTITLSALAQGAGDAGAGGRRVGGRRARGRLGAERASTRAPRSWCATGAPEAIEAMRTSVARGPGAALNRASILFAVGVRQARKAQVQVHARPR